MDWNLENCNLIDETIERNSTFFEMLVIGGYDYKGFSSYIIKLIDEAILHLISGLAFFSGSVVLSYFSIKSRGRIRFLAIIFLVFTLVHSLYHVTSFFDQELLSEGLLEPLSVIILILFGVSYLIIKSRQEIKTLE